MLTSWITDKINSFTLSKGFEVEHTILSLQFMFRMINIHHQLQIKDQEPISKVKNLFCAKDAISK